VEQFAHFRYADRTEATAVESSTSTSSDSDTDEAMRADAAAEPAGGPPVRRMRRSNVEHIVAAGGTAQPLAAEGERNARGRHRSDHATRDEHNLVLQGALEIVMDHITEPRRQLRSGYKIRGLSRVQKRTLITPVC